MKTPLPADVREAIVKALGAALASAWRAEKLRTKERGEVVENHKAP